MHLFCSGKPVLIGSGSPKPRQAALDRPEIRLRLNIRKGRTPGGHRVKATTSESEPETQTQSGSSQVPSATSLTTEISYSQEDKLFSTIDASAAGLIHKPGTVFASATLVAGTTVGAGILALPYSTQDAGFTASAAALTFAAFYNIITGLLIAEVSVNTMCQLGRGSTSIKTMAERTLGKAGAKITSASYIFLHYAMLSAYVTRSGEIIGDWTHLSHPVMSIAFVGGLGALCFKAPSKLLDDFNSTLVIAILVTFGGLLVAAGGNIEPSALGKADWSALPETVPTLSLVCVYQNVVPVIASSLEGDIKKVRIAVCAGIAVPLVMFIAWDATILGNLGNPHLQEVMRTTGAKDPLDLLSKNDPVVGPLIQFFSLAALTTSLIGFTLGLVDFVGDSLPLPPKHSRLLSYLAALLPPAFFGVAFPDAFFSALDVAGTYGVLLLFGVIPAAMAWRERYGETTLSRMQVVGGGAPVLLGIGGFAAVVITKELSQTLINALPH
ncbi:hypothetical protein WJX84_001096 [Apatococcus fuscideae]|uniref:Tyrosine-specific transport protein n=1 Tax=Apatococcus fuscideae TaxID=2026836 RepID=A0AAW1TFS1_9CHLO